MISNQLLFLLQIGHIVPQFTLQNCVMLQVLLEQTAHLVVAKIAFSLLHAVAMSLTGLWEGESWGLSINNESSSHVTALRAFFVKK